MSNVAEFLSTFESLARENGTITWHEDDLMVALGYTQADTFRKVVYRAMQACLSINSNPVVDFIPVGERYKFTRVACYLIAMSADPKKPQVATAKVCLAQFANNVQDYYAQSAMVDRVVIREEVRGGMKSLASTANAHGVVSYGAFMDEGYRGMYNMRLKEIERLKGVNPGEHLIDRMDKTELAANLFRVTLTDGRIKKESVRGQKALEAAAFDVGRIVRGAVIEAGNPPPEDLPLAEHINDTRKTLKASSAQLKKIRREDVEAEIQFHSATPENEFDPGYTPDPDEETQPDSDVPF